jgi:hypothetical protein
VQRSGEPKQQERKESHVAVDLMAWR